MWTKIFFAIYSHFLKCFAIYRNSQQYFIGIGQEVTGMDFFPKPSPGYTPVAIKVNRNKNFQRFSPGLVPVAKTFHLGDPGTVEA